MEIGKLFCFFMQRSSGCSGAFCVARKGKLLFPKLPKQEKLPQFFIFLHSSNMWQDDDDDENVNYFGEYVGKCRIKQNGHTFKKSPYSRFRQKALEIERNGSKVLKNDENYYEVPITEIDEYFDDAFWKENKRRPLNTRAQWEDILEILETSAVAVTKEFLHSSRQMRTHYDLPVIGHIIILPSSDNDPFDCQTAKSRQTALQVRKWLKWNGKLYDPSFIYQYIGSNYYANNGYLRKICSIKAIEKSMVLEQELGKTYPSSSSSSFVSSTTARYFPHHIKTVSLSIPNNDSRSYYEIDLGRITEITHLVSLGGFPKHLKLFPCRKMSNHIRIRHTRSASSTRKYDRYERSKNYFLRKKHVYIIDDEEDLTWVESFLLHYRDLTTGKWIQYNQIFNGNHDISTERVNEVSLLTRFVRITPVEYHHAKEMRMIFYGKETEPVSRTDATLEEAEEESLVQLSQTIRYTVFPQSLPDQYQGGLGCRCERCLPSPEKRKENRSYIRSMIRDVLLGSEDL
jgi:hypothetical protein